MAQQGVLPTNYNMCTQIVSTMPLTQEKHLENNFTNNNDHSYLHKKFKKKASTTTPSLESVLDPRQLENDKAQTFDKILKRTNQEENTIEVQDGQNIFPGDKNVQTIFSIESGRLSTVNSNSNVTGQTSFTDEFSNKTENLENHFSKETQNGVSGGRYICPYCKLSCAKPSVLQKHIRAHTNERPYPCIPCGFAFKTKSNLYKHCRSRTHALRSQGADVNASINEDDLSGGSESDTSQPLTSISESGSEASIFRMDNYRPNEFSSPELISDRVTPPASCLSIIDSKSKSIYKPKFRAAFYQEISDKEKAKKNISPNADFLTEHISKIISDNEAIVDVIEIPLQKMYGKLKPERQFLYDNTEMKGDSSPLNLTKSSTETESTFRKRSHSESFSQLDQKHPLNPEGSIIKDLLLKTKANGVLSSPGEQVEGPLYVCPVCPISYRSADNLEIHRLYYCKGNTPPNTVINSHQKEHRSARPDNVFVRSNSINVRLPETHPTFVKVNAQNKFQTEKIKPDNLVIIKPESNDVVAPLPSPGPLLGNTRLVDTRTPEFGRKTEALKIKPTSSPKRRMDCRSESYSPRLSENSSPRSNSDVYPQSKVRCIEQGSITFRSIDELSQQMRHNSTSLQMFGGEVKIVDHFGSTTTLRIEPNKNQLSPILIHQNVSPSKLVNDAEASSVVVRSGLHSGGTIVHNPPTPKEMVGTPQPQTPRITISAAPGLSHANISGLHDMSHFQFPPLSAITAYNPLTLPPLSPTTPNGATTIFHGGKLIPHVPGIPGPNSPNIYVSSQTHSKVISNDNRVVSAEILQERCRDNSPPVNIQHIKGTLGPKPDNMRSPRSPNFKTLHVETEKSKIIVSNANSPKQLSTIPTIRVKNVDETHPKFLPTVPKLNRQESSLKRTSDGLLKATSIKETQNISSSKLKLSEKYSQKTNEIQSENEIRNFNFENLITKAEIYNNNQMPSSSEVQKNTNAQETPTTSNQNERSETSYFQKSTNAKSINEDRKPKFLRPSTLPLKPGTFTPKRHHGITPNANTLPLVSPETPRPAKAYGQLYLNGNAYTYLGLKCSTKVFYCTINRLQPTYVPNQHFLSMYSNWQLLSELTPDPLGLSASSAMSLYDSRHRPQNVAVTVIKQDLILTHSSQWNKTSKEHKQSLLSIDAKRVEDNKLQLSDNILTPKKELAGGFESNEEYTYVRGRGRGRYVCSECGIRCKKPSMLKKHIRTHTDVRPFTCNHCAFSFKTKGNLTKHMKSKAHYKKCCELGINPNEGIDAEGGEMSQFNGSGETDEDTDSDGDEGNEGETESSDTEVGKSQLPEHEAAHCLLSLGSSRPATSANPGLITSARPTTYPYAPTGVETTSADVKFVQMDTSSVDSRDTDNEPMDLSKSDIRASSIPEIPTARESSVLASLASNTAKLPQHQNQWSNGEPMLHTYLTERALLDTKIKQSQLAINPSLLRKIELEKNIYSENNKILKRTDTTETTNSVKAVVVSSVPSISSYSKLAISTEHIEVQRSSPGPLSDQSVCNITEAEIKRPLSINSNSEFVFTELIVKHPRINQINAFEVSKKMEQGNNGLEEKVKLDDIQISDTEVIKIPPLDHDPVARKVVVGAGGVAFKVTKGKEFDGSSYSQGRLMEDGRRVCDFCNKSFTKPSQLRLHLNIHYMERPFRCSACAVSFRTRGHLQKHERSGSHHNKVSMTSTFGAATSLNPRPFRCSDCNIAFRIHGHLAKHLRSKMHVMRLECLFKLPFGTFTEIERAGVSLTDIDTTDCASSLASLQSLARKLHEKDPTKLEYREPTSPPSLPAGRDSSEEDDMPMSIEKTLSNSDDRDSELKNSDISDNQDIQHKGVM